MQVGQAMRRRIMAEDPAGEGGSAPFHQRTPSRKEIDFVSKHLGGVAIESKYIESGRWRGAAATLEASAWQGILATRNVLDVPDPSSAWAVPACMLAYLIDT